MAIIGIAAVFDTFILADGAALMNLFIHRVLVYFVKRAKSGNVRKEEYLSPGQRNIKRT